jgi:hypothetical protein
MALVGMLLPKDIGREDGQCTQPEKQREVPIDTTNRKFCALNAERDAPLLDAA